jgi:maltose O-acetyltransferase
MGLRFVIAETILRNLFELESRLAKHGDNKRFLKRYLKLMQVRHGQVVTIGQGFYLRNRGNLVLGERCGIGSFSRIWNYNPITIGDDFLTAAGLTMNTATHDAVTLEPSGEQIRIGNRVWCGMNVTILAGVTIGDDVVLGAGSVVTTDIPANSIAVGVPAKKIKDLERLPGQALWRWD